MHGISVSFWFELLPIRTLGLVGWSSSCLNSSMVKEFAHAFEPNWCIKQQLNSLDRFSASLLLWLYGVRHVPALNKPTERQCWAKVQVPTLKGPHFCWTWSGLELLRLNLDLNWTFTIGLGFARKATHSFGLDSIFKDSLQTNMRRKKVSELPLVAQATSTFPRCGTHPFPT